MKTAIAAAWSCAALAASALLSACGGTTSPGSTSYTPAGATQQSARQQSAHQQWAPYGLLTLDSLGGNLSFAINIDDSSQASGTSLVGTTGDLHAQVWERPPHTIDLGTLGGPNSAVFQYNHGRAGQFVGWSETSTVDPNDENFCGFGTSQVCLGFNWQRGKMTALPPLGGNNDNANDVNVRGQIVGASEVNTTDSSCPPPRVYDFVGVIWQPNGKTTVLPPYTGDTVSYGYTMTQSGQEAVGQSGTCAAAAAHAVLWRNASSPTNLGTLGGTVNVALDINESSQIIGNSDLYGNTITHTFLWQRGTMNDLGTLSGDTNSFAGGINSRGQIVGESCDASGNCRGYLWEHGTMTDLNTLIPPQSGLNVLFGANINDWGEIVGATVDTQGVESAVLLYPHGRKLQTRENTPAYAIKTLGRASRRGVLWDLRSRGLPK